MIALTAARLFDGERVVDQPVVVIDGDRIVSVGQDPPSVAEVVDLGAATLLPGLIDTHLHLVFNGVGTLEEMVTGVSDEELLARCRENATKALRAGITTIRDLGDKDYISLPLRNDPSLPTILCSGPPITVGQGHCWYLGGECDPADLPAAIAERAERGCDVVKVMVSGGILTPTFPMYASQFGTDEMTMIVNEAHRHGMPVAAHCHGTPAIVSSIDAGVDTLEHCTFFGEDNMSHPDDAIFQRLIDLQLPISATLGAVPGNEPPPVVQRSLQIMFDAFSRFIAHGGCFSCGTDAGIGMGKPHDVLPHAFRMLVDDIGVSRDRALRAMTSDGAKVIGLADRKGRLVAGYDADILAVAGNPLADGDLLAPVGVWRAGRRIV